VVLPSGSDNTILRTFSTRNLSFPPNSNTCYDAGAASFGFFAGLVAFGVSFGPSFAFTGVACFGLLFGGPVKAALSYTCVAHLERSKSVRGPLGVTAISSGCGAWDATKKKAYDKRQNNCQYPVSVQNVKWKLTMLQAKNVGPRPRPPTGG
jgi:hypothetical protein